MDVQFEMAPYLELVNFQLEKICGKFYAFITTVAMENQVDVAVAMELIA